MKFKIEWLGHYFRNGHRMSRWQTTCLDAKDPIDARDKFWVKHPGQAPSFIYEIDSNGNELHRWNFATLAKNEHEIKIQYDMRVK